MEHPDLQKLVERSNHPVIREKMDSGIGFSRAYETDPKFRETCDWLYQCACGGGERGD